MTTVKEILRLLFTSYGHDAQVPTDDPVGGLVGTILSQHTSDVNSNRAHDELLKRFPTWDAVADANPRSIAAAIKCGGLARMKAPRIRAILREIRRKHGTVSLNHIRGMSTEEVLRELCAFDGVGIKTAACVAAFDLGRDVCPVDTHVHRVTKRLGWVPKNASAEAAFECLAQILPAGKAVAAHLALIRHGRRICRPTPKCAECPIRRLCPSVQSEP